MINSGVNINFKRNKKQTLCELYQKKRDLNWTELTKEKKHRMIWWSVWTFCAFERPKEGRRNRIQNECDFWKKKREAWVWLREKRERNLCWTNERKRVWESIMNYFMLLILLLLLLMLFVPFVRTYFRCILMLFSLSIFWFFRNASQLLLLLIYLFFPLQNKTKHKSTRFTWIL